MLMLAEMNIKFFLTYFNFLDYNLGKGIFIVFIGSILLSNQLYAIIVGVIIIVVGFIYMLIGRNIVKEVQGGQATNPDAY